MGYDVFVSYRRDLASSEARLIVSELSRRTLAGKSVSAFLDVDSLSSGHFDERLLRIIEDTPNFLPVLVPGSLDRCDESGDWVRREIEHAISAKCNVVPILFKGFRFGSPEDLPPGMRDLVRHNAVIVYPEYFNAAIDKMLTCLRTPSADSVEIKPAPRPEVAAPREKIMLIGDMVLALEPVLTEVTWHEAAERGASLVIRGQRGWKLPTPQQLGRIYRLRVFPPTSCYWSRKEVGSEARYLHFDDGHFGQGPKEHRRGMAAVFVTEKKDALKMDDGIILANWWR